MNDDRRAYKRQYQQEVRERNRQRIDDYLRSVHCADCSQSYPLPAMTLVHSEPGSLPYRGVLHNFGEDRLEAELAKLDVVCLNCQAIRRAQC